MENHGGGWLRRRRLYRRRAEIHSRFGGQQQGGISTPAEWPFLLLFSGSEGGAFGYSDSWTDNGTYDYYGEGQRGDMGLVRGNRAILEHSEHGKALHLFMTDGKGLVRYEGEMVCAGYREVRAPDADGYDRRAYVFELVPLEDVSAEVRLETHERPEEPLQSLREKAKAASTVGVSSGSSRREVYRRSAAVRAYVLARAGGRCEACGAAAPFRTSSGEPFLEAHHVRRLSDGGPDDPAYVGAVCPNCHRHAHYAADATAFNDRLAGEVRAAEAVVDL